MQKETGNYSSAGDKNLESLDGAHRFTEWMFSEVAPHLCGTILEIGSGRGTYSKKVLRDFPKNIVYLSELDRAYVETLQKDFPTAHVVSLDITSTNVLPKESIDSAFALNVFEHIENDELAFTRMYEMLKPGGAFVILVPAHQWLYNSLDRAIDHYRRYSKKELIEKATRAGFIVTDAHFFNAPAIPGWWWNGTVLKKTTLSSGLVKIFNVLVPFFSFMERTLLKKTLGISVVGVLQKPTE